MNLTKRLFLTALCIAVPAGLSAMEPSQRLRKAIAGGATPKKIETILAQKPGFDVDILFLFTSDTADNITNLKKILAYADTCDSEKSWRQPLLNHVRDDGITLLHKAINEGWNDMVETLVTEGANVSFETTYYGTPKVIPLMRAVSLYCATHASPQFARGVTLETLVKK